MLREIGWKTLFALIEKLFSVFGFLFALFAKLIALIEEVFAVMKLERITTVGYEG